MGLAIGWVYKGYPGGYRGRVYKGYPGGYRGRYILRGGYTGDADITTRRTYDYYDHEAYPNHPNHMGGYPILQ